MTDARRRPTTGPEWVTFALAAVIVLGILGTVLSQMVTEGSPPSPRVAVGAVAERDGSFIVPVRLTNDGDETAQDVQVNATLTTKDGETTSDQIVAFLAGGEEERLEFVFEDDPGDGELVVGIGGYRLP